MALYILTYDLRKHRDYQPLYDELAAFKAVAVLESVWCFNRFDTTAGGLRDYFKQFIDADDGLFVAEVAQNAWGGYNTLATPNEL
jgi:hypothetical protein